MQEYTNKLIQETSPYLLQHAHNPVDWVPWSESVFEQAKKENKLVLVSVGYSACHWCHVMEHECFEDEEVAAIMNKFFINVKVDREERPDVDQVYMSAVQLMTRKGGWPLNCITLPDGRPIYGGTYYPKEQWMDVLKSLHQSFTNDFGRVEEYASKVHQGIVQSEVIQSPAPSVPFEEEKLKELSLRWSKMFDLKNGGATYAPKFPIPNNYEFLLDYALNSGDEVSLKHVELTLDKMAMGGIYDQIGGGFSRYSVDMLWKVPHFEKMLYDNGQLVSLFSKAYKTFNKPLYKHVVYQTINWLERELSDSSGAFYSALDADSEGIEGKFYVWKKDELKDCLQNDYDWVCDYYQVNQMGFWEDGNYILLRHENDIEFANKMSWSQEELEQQVNRINELLLSERSHRIRPGLDDKCLTSWNAMMLKGLCDAYSVFQEDLFLHLAIKNAKWMMGNQLKESGELFRSFKNGKSSINGFLEDYAHVIDAYISLYIVTGEDNWLHDSKTLTEYAISKFFDKKSGMFFFSDENTELIARKMEIMDNVIPSSNSVMARNLYYLGKYFHKGDFISKAKQMLLNVYDGMETQGSNYSNWAILLNHEIYSLYEFVCVGEKSADFAKEISTRKAPHLLIAHSKNNNDSLPIFEDKKSDDSTIFICTEGTCLQPVNNIEDAIKMVIQ